MCPNGWSLDWEESEAPICSYITNFVTEIWLTKDLHSYELVLFLSLKGLMQTVNFSGFPLKLFRVLRCAIGVCWYSGWGVKLRLRHSTIQILMRECLLQSFPTWVTLVQASCLFSTPYCSKKYSFWVCLLLLVSYSYVILEIVLKKL